MKIGCNECVCCAAEKSSECPESHPFTFDNFKSCCSQGERDPLTCPLVVPGSLLEKDSAECCQDSDYVTCSDPPCKSHSKAFEIEGEGSVNVCKYTGCSGNENV